MRERRLERKGRVKEERKKGKKDKKGRYGREGGRHKGVWRKQRR